MLSVSFGAVMTILSAKIFPLEHSGHLIIGAVDRGGLPKRDRASRHILGDGRVHGYGADPRPIVMKSRNVALTPRNDQVPMRQWPETTICEAR